MSEILKELAKELLPLMEQERGRKYGVGFKHDASGTPIGSGYTHGPGGLLTFPGVDPDVFSAVVGNKSMLGNLPTKSSVFMTPTYTTITGVQDVSGNNKNNVCDNAPTAGLMKACTTWAPFGRYEMSTPEIELNRLGALNDRADPMDLRLIGTPIAEGPFNSGQGSADTPADVLTNEVSRKFWERNVAFHRLLSQQIWRGNPANNSAGGGYKEVASFTRLVNTGYRDAETGVVCPAVDSYLRNANHARLDLNTQFYIGAITDVYYQLKDRAYRMGYDPVRWVLAMRPQLFYEITALWPCAYLSYRCNPNTGATEFIDAQDAVRFRDEMRAGKYLLIDGDRIEVVVDDGITELNGNNSGGNFPSGCFESDIYFIPMSVIGGQAVTFLEYFQYSNPSLQDALGNMVLAKVDGAFLTWPRQTNQCVVWQSKIEPRLVMRTPWLAGRLQNVVYCPTQHGRDTFPADPYFADGGKTNRTGQGPSYFALWKS